MQLIVASWGRNDAENVVHHSWFDVAFDSMQVLPNFNPRVFISNPFLLKPSQEVVRPVCVQNNIKLSYAQPRRESKLPSPNFPRLHKRTIDDAAKSWPQPRWNVCIGSVMMFIVRRPGISISGTSDRCGEVRRCPMVVRQIACFDNTCQSLEARNFRMKGSSRICRVPSLLSRTNSMAT